MLLYYFFLVSELHSESVPEVQDTEPVPVHVVVDKTQVVVVTESLVSVTFTVEVTVVSLF